MGWRVYMGECAPRPVRRRHKLPEKVTDPSWSVFPLQTTLARRRTEEDRAARYIGVDSADLFVRPSCVHGLRSSIAANIQYIRVDSGTSSSSSSSSSRGLLPINWSVTCPTRLETRTNASVHVRQSVDVTKGEVKAIKSSAFCRKGYDHLSVAGGGALPLWWTRRSENVHVMTRKITSKMKLEETLLEVGSDSNVQIDR